MSARSAHGGSTEYSETWPASGMTHTGRAFVLPTLAQCTDESACLSSPTTKRAEASSLLPTPNTGDSKSSQPVEKRKAKRHQVRLGDLLVTAPPPQMGWGQAASHATSTGRIGGEINAEENGAGTQRLGGTPGAFEWGPYEAAVRRWEAVTGRPAPCPVELGTRGQQRLSSPFVEWLMGLPDGYVTELGLPRNGELRALGNGVVPQQAETALLLLMKI